MAVDALALAWFGLVVALGWRRRPLPGRRVVEPERSRQPVRPADVLEWCGRRLAGRKASAATARHVARAVLAAAVAALLLPAAAPAAGVAAWLTPRLRARREAARAAEAVRSSLPEVVDLVAVAVGAGLTVVQAIDAVGERAHGPVAAALAAAGTEIRLGRRCADALDELPAHVGDEVRPLAAALAASERYGAPLVAALDRLAAEQREVRRRHAEAAARRVPVKLLFPLVLCVLPAFGLLTMAPLLAGALGSLRL